MPTLPLWHRFQDVHHREQLQSGQREIPVLAGCKNANRVLRRAAPGGYWGRDASLQYQGAPLLVCDDRLHGKQNGLEAEEAHLHLDVLRLASPIQEDLIGASYRLSLRIADCIPGVFLGAPNRPASFPTAYRCVYCTHRRIPFLVFLAAL